MSQYCRACGTDLRPVRVSLERPDSITASAISARDEIGRAVAEKIRGVDNSRDLKIVAEDVLPQIEKFLESPEEKRLRRLRAGVITALIGLGVAVPTLVFTSAVHGDAELMFLFIALGLGVITFTIGLALVINGLLFTRPRKGIEDNSSDANLQNLLDAEYAPPQLRPADAQVPFRSPATKDLSRPASSITEHTTKHLKS